MIAIIAKYDELTVPNVYDKEFEKLSKKDKLIVSKLIAIFRIANALDKAKKQKKPNQNSNQSTHTTNQSTAIKRGVKERALCNYAKKMYMIYAVNQKFYLSLPILLSFNHFSNYIAIAHY